MITIGKILKEYLEDNRISQSEFAEMYNVSVKHINEIINDKTGVSMDMLLLISLLTEYDADLLLMINEHNKIEKYLNDNFKTEKAIKEYINSYNVKDIENNKWYTFRNLDDNAITYIDLLKYLKTNSLDNHLLYTKNNYLYKEVGEKDLIKVALWIAHCNNLIEGIEVPKYSSSNLDKLFKELEIERTKEFNKDNLIKIFNKYGIILVIEEPLKGTKVRGVTHVKIDTPVIYMNTYYKNISSFYFALYHELGHVKTHFNMLKSKTVVHSDDMEDEMDEFALEKMIPKKIYDVLNNNNVNVKDICNKNNIPLSFYYSRLAYEGKISYNSKKLLDSHIKINL
jgi:HTH-type transcriptional regulator/antitoxin HigA